MSNPISHPIVFLAFASAWNAGELASLPAEARALRSILEPLADRGQIGLVLRQDVTTNEVLGLFLDARYAGRIAVFHFAGHADQYGLLLSDSVGRLEQPQAAGFAAYLAQQRGLRLVFLNGCTTDEQAKELLDAGVPVVIATQVSIADDLAAEFSARFYQAFAAGTTVEAAYATAEAAACAVHGDTVRNSWKLHLDRRRPEAGAWTLLGGTEGDERAPKGTDRAGQPTQQIGKLDLRGAQGVNVGSAGSITQTFGPMTNTWGEEPSKPD